MRFAIDAQHAELDAGFAFDRGLAATQDGLNAQRQLAHAEGLDHVVVCAQLEADHAVDLFAARRQHDHGRGTRRGRLLQLLAHVRTAQVGQHQVEQDQVGVQLFDEPQTVTTGTSGRHFVPRLSQVVFEDRENVLLVFDYQNSGHPLFRVSGGCDDSVTGL
jgi:hypothetical protein